MSSTLLYEGHPFGEGWPADGLPVGSGGLATFVVQFSLPSLNQLVHGEFDWGVEVSSDPVRISNEAVAEAAKAKCNESSSNFGGSGYVDPSGTVRASGGAPVAGAKVVLLRAARRGGGKLRQVPNRSTVMSPSNRRNPDRTNALGHFGWDVLSGYYQVAASHRGCRGLRPRTRVFPVPPPVSDIVLTLRCRNLRRAATRLTVTAHRRGGRDVTLVARLRSRGKGRLYGFVDFKLGARTVGQASVDPRRDLASVTVRTTVVPSRIVAVYSGDAAHRAARRKA
jgi:hypothetical protein